MDAKTLGDTRIGVFDDQIERNHYIDGYGSLGITLRQHYAGLIFQQFMSGAVLPPDFDAAEQLAFCARRACEATDALLAELSKEPQP